MYLSTNAEEVLFEIFHIYQKRKRHGISHIEAKKFQFPLPGDGFLNEIESITEQLFDSNVIEEDIPNQTYVLTRIGIDYCMRIEYDEYTFEIAKEAVAKAAIAEKASNLATILSIISAAGTFGAFIVAIVALFR